jgi:hypothetical protein
VTEFVGVTGIEIDDVGVVSLPPPPVSAPGVVVNVVPFTVLVKVTCGLSATPSATKPAPLMVMTVEAGVVTSASDAVLVGVSAEEIDGSPYTVNAPVSVPVPLSSVVVTAYVPGTVADVDAKSPVRTPAVLSTTFENVIPGAVVVTVALPPSLANAPFTVKVPEAPVPMKPAFVTPPVMLNVTLVTVSAAPAAVAIAKGSAAAASKAPAASAFTKWRCIRLGLFIVNSLHS